MSDPRAAWEDRRNPQRHRSPGSASCPSRSLSSAHSIPVGDTVRREPREERVR